MVRAITTSNASCSNILLGSDILKQCNSSNIIDLNNLNQLCIADYNSDPVSKIIT